jgi:teichuronic acid biosynthesis glycosyltransferase TuaC
MRVLVLSSRFPDTVRPMAGNIVERQTLALAERKGIAVQVVAPLPMYPFPLSLLRRHRRLTNVPDEETWKGIRVHRPRYLVIPKTPASQPLFMQRRLLPLLKRIRREFPFEILAGQFFWPEGPAVVALGALLDIPVSLKGRGPDVETWAERPSAGSLIVEAGRRADGMLAISADLKCHMERLGMPGDRISVHYTGVDTELFKPGRAAAKAKLGIQGPLLLSVGNLIPRKGHDLVIEALTHLPQARLIVAGNGSLKEELEAWARALNVQDRVRLVGLVPHAEMPSLYAAADVTIHAASVEGFANARVESLACGTPVVTTAAGAPEEIITSPLAGKIVPRNAADIAAAALEFIRHPPPTPAVVAAVERFSWERNAAELEAHLRTLVERRQTRR